MYFFAHLLIGEHELEVFKLLAGLGNLVSRVVKSVPVFVLGTGLVVGEHAVATVHRENLVVYTAIITVLVAQIVQLLPQLGNQLVFLTGTEGNARIKLMRLQS